MGFFKALGFFAKAKSQNVGKTLIERLAEFDPETMGAAGLQEMESELDTILREVAQARQEYTKEQREAVVARQNYDQQYKAAELLNERLATIDPTSDEHGKVSTSLNKLLDALEKLLPEVEREEREAVEAKQVLDVLEDTARSCAESLKDAKSRLDSVKRDLKRAKADEERAKKDAERAALVAGLRDNSAKLGTAMGAVEKAAANAQARADAARSKATLLQKPKGPEDDEIIQQALQQASGASATPTSAADRLKALNKQ